MLARIGAGVVWKIFFDCALFTRCVERRVDILVRVIEIAHPARSDSAFVIVHRLAWDQLGEHSPNRALVSSLGRAHAADNGSAIGGDCVRDHGRARDGHTCDLHDERLPDRFDQSEIDWVGEIDDIAGSGFSITWRSGWSRWPGHAGGTVFAVLAVLAVVAAAGDRNAKRHHSGQTETNEYRLIYPHDSNPLCARNSLQSVHISGQKSKDCR
jgi:hypothetical protein